MKSPTGNPLNEIPWPPRAPECGPPTGEERERRQRSPTSEISSLETPVRLAWVIWGEIHHFCGIRSNHLNGRTGGADAASRCSFVLLVPLSIWLGIFTSDFPLFFFNFYLLFLIFLLSVCHNLFSLFHSAQIWLWLSLPFFLPQSRPSLRHHHVITTSSFVPYSPKEAIGTTLG